MRQNLGGNVLKLIRLDKISRFRIGNMVYLHFENCGLVEDVRKHYSSKMETHGMIPPLQEPVQNQRAGGRKS